VSSLLTLLNSPRYYKKVLATRPLAYWPLWETEGSVAHDISGNGFHGSYVGVELGRPGIGDGRTAPLFDGVNDYGNIYTPALANAFNGAEGALLAWVRVANAGIWTDGWARRFVQIRCDLSNWVYFERTVANNQITLNYVAGGVGVGKAFTTSSPDWLFCAVTWSATADQFTACLNNVVDIQTGLGVWAGVLDSTRCVLGAQNIIPSAVWLGYIAHCAYWDHVLPLTTIKYLSRPR
jgi:hypothetical protein